MNIQPSVPTPQTESRFQNFVVFEPASLRISDSDILLTGEKIMEMFDRLNQHLPIKDPLKEQILRNRITKIHQMLNLVDSYDMIIVTKFFDRIWKRYSYVSNLGELFLDYSTFEAVFPEMHPSPEAVVATRVDDSDDDMDGDNDDDNDDDNEDDDNSSESKKDEED